MDGLLTANRRELFAGLHPGGECHRPVDQSGNVPHIERAVEAETEDASVLPSDDRGTTKRSTVKDHRRSNCETDGAFQLRTAGRKIQQVHGMPISVGLKECRQGKLGSRIEAAVGEWIAGLSGRNGSCHQEIPRRTMLPDSKRIGESIAGATVIRFRQFRYDPPLHVVERMLIHR